MITFAVVIYFTLFSIFASFMIFRSKIGNILKTLLPALLFISIAFSYVTMSYEKGFPTYATPPEGKIAWIEILQPTKEDGGGIFIWMYPKYKEQWKLGYFLSLNNNERPKSYGIPYTKDDAEKYSRLKESVKKGYYVDRVDRHEAKDEIPDTLIDKDFFYKITDPRSVNRKKRG